MDRFQARNEVAEFPACAVLACGVRFARTGANRCGNGWSDVGEFGCGSERKTNTNAGSADWGWEREWRTGSERASTRIYLK